MRLLIDGQTLLTADINRGIGKYFISCIENILHYDFTNDFYLTSSAGTNLSVFSPWARAKLQILENEAYNPRPSANRHEPHAEGLFSDALANDIERLGINVYWCPNALMGNVILPARQTTRCLHAVTIFDLIPLVMKNEYEKHWPPSSFAAYTNKLKRVAADFDLFLHISNHTRSDLLDQLPVAEKRHVVTHLAADKAFRPHPFPRTAASDYIIYPGGFDPRKNMERAIEGFARLHAKYGADDRVNSAQLWIVCSSDHAGETQLLNLAKKLGVGAKVRLTGFIEDHVLIETYQRARCLFFPSLYEGFGLPVLEGLACGLPVLASSSSSIPEVGSDLAIYFDPYDVDAMAEALREGLHAPLDLESRFKRYEYSTIFNWKKTALATLDALGRREQAKSTEPAATDDPGDPDFIDVRQRMKELSVEELCATAEEFYARLDKWDYLHAKPFAAVNETPELLINFAQVVRGLKLLPEMTILDFGAGACWTSRFLTQLGLQVVAVDVSASALRIGEELYRRYSPVGDQPPPKFLRFDGRRLDLPDESFDRISCWDAFHHVPNPGDVLREMARVLKSGGIAGFAEPGPDHSKSPQSQYEMRTNRLIENDVDLVAIWHEAQAAGFTDLRLAIFNPEGTLLPLEEFEDCLSGKDAAGRYIAETREQMRHRRVFFLFKGESTALPDSRQRDGLRADLKVEAVATSVKAGESLTLKVVATNSGSTAWLLRDARVGLVRFGIHLFTSEGKLIDLDYYRQDLPNGNREMMPGETTEFTAQVPLPAIGTYLLQCDLVSENVCWFEHNGSATVKLTVNVH
jgi:glycosyltransferase involved in cell wall biosynthesis/SAM-dependent methyltransferase